VKRVMVRYRVKPERASENVELVRAVYDELHETRPEGLRYATFKLDDGVSFVHLAEHDEDGPNQLTRLASFQRFQEGIKERCDDPPGRQRRQHDRCLSASRRVIRAAESDRFRTDQPNSGIVGSCSSSAGAYFHLSMTFFRSSAGF